WHERWENGQIAFHEARPHPMMVAGFASVVTPPARVLVPLCGKSNDLIWLRDQGYDVVGAELDRSAVEAFFAENGLAAEVTPSGGLTHYASGAISIFQGDFFTLTPEQTGPIDGVFDRAALVALPPEMRVRYAHHLAALAPRAPQFQITFEYDQTTMDGPPFSVRADEIARHYADAYAIADMERRAISGPLSMRTQGEEIAWRLLPK
ncbi:MAG: thiopurine S-methyltransferase, partial [Pseudomonadota bacterium]